MPATFRTIYILGEEAILGEIAGAVGDAADCAIHPFQFFPSLRKTASTSAPGCVIVAWTLLPAPGFEGIADLAAACDCSPVVVLKEEPSLRFAVNAIRAGAADVIELPIDPPVLKESLDLAFEDLRRRQDRAQERGRARTLLAALSQRERQIFDLILAGLSNKLIANELGISVRTVEMHRANMMQKLGAKSLQAVMQIGLRLTSTGS